MKGKIIGITTLIMLVLATTALAGNFRILDASLAELFEVSSTGVVSVKTSLFVPTLVVNGTLFNATTATVDFAADAIPEGDIAFATSCGTGYHLYISGNDLACEVDANDITTDAIVADWGFIKLENLTSVSDTNESVRFDFLVATDCAAGQLVIGVNTTGGVLCSADANTQLSDANIADFGFIKLANATQVDTNESVRFNMLVGTDCAAGQLVIGVNATGGVLCAADSEGTGIDNVIEDLTPQLGGNLDLNTFDIFNAAGGITNMTIDGTGNFIITLGS